MAEFNVDLKETADAMINWAALLLGIGVLPFPPSSLSLKIGRIRTRKVEVAYTIAISGV
jgi:hypothetical protein